jgi:hypothetical protein
LNPGPASGPQSVTTANAGKEERRAKKNPGRSDPGFR